MIGVALGVNNLVEIFNEKYYENLPGGILESFGRMFRHAVKLYVYPMRARLVLRAPRRRRSSPGSRGGRPRHGRQPPGAAPSPPSVRPPAGEPLHRGRHRLQPGDAGHRFPRCPRHDQARRPCVGGRGAARRRRHDPETRPFWLPARGGGMTRGRAVRVSRRFREAEADPAGPAPALGTFRPPVAESRSGCLIPVQAPSDGRQSSSSICSSLRSLWTFQATCTARSTGAPTGGRRWASFQATP